MSPPQPSPEIWVSESPHLHRSSSRSTHRLKSSVSGSHPSFDESADALGIHLGTFSPVKSPKSIYRTSPVVSPETTWSPLPTYGKISSYQRTPESIHSWDTSFTRARTDPMTERLIQYRATQAARWKVHWRVPTLIAFSFIAGIALAIGQHLLYTSLHRKVEPDEERKIRVVLYGRALAYLSKVAFGGCVILCYRQRIWTTFRTTSLSVWSIDQLFNAEEDPSLFLNPETVTKASLVTVMALGLWLIPVATIVFSPAALTFGNTLQTELLQRPVPTINFTAESFKDWRKPVVASDGTKKRSLVNWNTTDLSATTSGWFDYYDQPSADLKRISLMAGYSLKNEPLNRDDARRASCGGDFNCSFTISFEAPGYNCQLFAQGTEDSEPLAATGQPINSSLLSPLGDDVYRTEVDIGNYLRPQQADGGLSPKGGVPNGEYDDLFGVFTHEPVLWIGYSVNSSVLIDPNSPLAQNWTHQFNQYIYACRHYDTNYTVDFNYTGPFMTRNVSNEFLRPVVDTNISQSTGNPEPQSNYISPRTNVAHYKRTAAYHAMGERLRHFLRGTVELVPPIPGPSYAKVFSEITSTRLVSGSAEPYPDLGSNLLQSFYADMIISLFSAPHLLVVSNVTVPVIRSRYRSTFIYNPHKLWACYAPVILMVFIFLLVGAWTIYQDGTTFSVGFSRIMVTTRNRTLDEISRGACLGNDPFPLELMHTRLKFGVLNDGSQDTGYAASDRSQMVEHCTFGVPSEIGPIRHGMTYAGFPDRRRCPKLKVD